MEAWFVWVPIGAALCVSLWMLGMFRPAIYPGDPIGLMQASGRKRYGTLGCVLRQANRSVVLSCAHAFRPGAHGDKIGRYCNRSRRFKNAFGTLGFLSSHSNVDCCLIQLSPRTRIKCTFSPTIKGIDPNPIKIDDLNITPSKSQEGRMRVQKIGASTGHTFGLAGIGIFSTMSYSSPDSRTPNSYSIDFPFIEIKTDYYGEGKVARRRNWSIARRRRHTVQSKSATRFDFCTSGDSGSVVWSAPENSSPPRPLALLVAASDDSKSDLGKFGYAIPIERVLIYLREQRQTSHIHVTDR